MVDQESMPKLTRDEPDLPWMDWVEDVSKTGARYGIPWWGKIYYFVASAII